MGDRVFVKVDASEEKTATGILLPTSAQKRPTQGHVVGGGKAVKVRAWRSWTGRGGAARRVQGWGGTMRRSNCCLRPRQ